MPMTQGERFDPSGHYVRTWIPELGRLPDRFLHKPWEAPTDVLRAAGVQLGKDYPRPTVEHRAARDRFPTVARRHLKRRTG
jgi:deoxyribodipyrimidine photo-lyase